MYMPATMLTFRAAKLVGGPFEVKFSAAAPDAMATVSDGSSKKGSMVSVRFAEAERFCSPAGAPGPVGAASSAVTVSTRGCAAAASAAASPSGSAVLNCTARSTAVNCAGVASAGAESVSAQFANAPTTTLASAAGATSDAFTASASAGAQPLVMLSVTAARRCSGSTTEPCGATATAGPPCTQAGAGPGSETEGALFASVHAIVSTAEQGELIV